MRRIAQYQVHIYVMVVNAYLKSLESFNGMNFLPILFSSWDEVEAEKIEYEVLIG